MINIHERLVNMNVIDLIALLDCSFVPEDLKAMAEEEFIRRGKEKRWNVLEMQRY